MNYQQLVEATRDVSQKSHYTMILKRYWWRMDYVTKSADVLSSIIIPTVYLYIIFIQITIDTCRFNDWTGIMLWAAYWRYHFLRVRMSSQKVLNPTMGLKELILSKINHAWMSSPLCFIGGWEGLLQKWDIFQLNKRCIGDWRSSRIEKMLFDRWCCSRSGASSSLHLCSHAGWGCNAKFALQPLYLGDRVNNLEGRSFGMLMLGEFFSRFFFWVFLTGGIPANLPWNPCVCGLSFLGSRCCRCHAISC